MPPTRFRKWFGPRTAVACCGHPVVGTAAVQLQNVGLRCQQPTGMLYGGRVVMSHPNSHVDNVDTINNAATPYPSRGCQHSQWGTPPSVLNSCHATCMRDNTEVQLSLSIRYDSSEQSPAAEQSSLLLHWQAWVPAPLWLHPRQETPFMHVHQDANNKCLAAWHATPNTQTPSSKGWTMPL